MISLSQDLRLPALLRRLQTGVIVCALIITGPGLSQVAGQPDTTETDSLYFPMQYDSVIVTASRAQVPPGETGLSIDQISKTSLRNLGVTGPMAQALEEVPGVFVQDRGNLSLGERITIRGVGTRAQFGVRGIMIVVDNIPLTLPDGQAQTNNIQWNSIQQIEVLRGPSASLYGNAAGGVIRLQTGIPKHTGPMALRVRQEFGSYGQRQTGVSLMGEKNRFSYLAGLTHTATEGFRDHSESSFTRINLKSRYGFSDQMSVTGVINYYNAPYLLNPSSLGKQDARENPTKARDYIQSQGAGEQVWQGQAGVTLNYRFGADEYLESTLYGARRELTNPIPGRIIQLDRFTGGWRTVYNGQKVLVNRELHIKLGMDLDTQFDDRREFVNRGLPEGEIGTFTPDQVIGQVRFGDQLLDQAERVISFAPFGQVKYAFTPRFQFILGGRYDRYMYSVTDRLEESRATRWMRQFSPRLGLICRFAKQHQLYANYSHGFQPPTTSELSNRPDAQGGFHPDLQPEQIRNVEAGIRGRFGGDRFDYSIALYNMHYQDMLIPYQSPVPGIEEVFYENAGSAGNLGLEGRLRWRILPSLEYTVMFTGQRFQFQDFITARGSENEEEGSQLSGNLVPGVPPLRGFMNLTYRSEMYFAGLDFQWVDDYYANNYNGPPPDETGSRSAYRNSGYSVVDLQAGVNGSILRAGYRVGFALNNLFDQRYNSSVIPNAFGGRFFEPAPGRHWSLEVQLTLGKEGRN